MYLLGYLPAHNKIYLCDKDVNFFSFSLSLSLIEYQTAVLRGDLENAAEILPSIPPEQRNRIARFLETQGMSFHFHSSDVLTSLPARRSTRTRAVRLDRSGPQIRPSNLSRRSRNSASNREDFSANGFADEMANGGRSSIGELEGRFGGTMFQNGRRLECAIVDLHEYR